MSRHKKAKSPTITLAPAPSPVLEASEHKNVDEGAVQAFLAEVRKQAATAVAMGAAPDPLETYKDGEAILLQLKKARRDRTPEFLALEEAPGVPWSVPLVRLMKELYVCQAKPESRILDKPPDATRLKAAISNYAEERSRLIDTLEGYREDPAVVAELRGIVLREKSAPTTAAACVGEINCNLAGIDALGLRAPRALRRMKPRLEAALAMFGEAEVINGRPRATTTTWITEAFTCAQAVAIVVSEIVKWAGATATTERRDEIRRAVGIQRRGRGRSQGKAGQTAGDTSGSGGGDAMPKSSDGKVVPADDKSGSSGEAASTVTARAGGEKPKG